MGVITELVILVLAAWVGIEVVSKVPQMLHTPLMSGTNAIHGVVLVGAILVLGAAAGGTVEVVCGIIAVAFGAANVGGGFVVTDRMLQMFKRRPEPKREGDE
jgi:NAD(P) transhydrogenase subunit alpha